MQGASYMQAWWLTIEVPKKARENSSKNTFDPAAFLRSGPLQNREQTVVPTGVKGVTSQDADVREQAETVSVLS